MADRGFFSHQVCRITGLSAPRLGYWRKTGLLSPEGQAPGGHGRYSFTDLVALDKGRRLIATGVSAQRIRNCLQSVTQSVPATGKPLQEL